MEVIKVILIFILFQVLLVFILKTIGRTYLYKKIFLNKEKRTCLKIIDSIEYEFLPSQKKLLHTFKKIKPLVKKRFIMGESKTDYMEDYNSASLNRKAKSLKQFSVEIICETLKGAIYKEVNIDGLTFRGQDYLQLYKQAIIYLITKEFYTSTDEKIHLKLVEDDILVLGKIQKNEFVVVDEFRSVIYPKYIFKLIDTGEDKLLITDFRDLISLDTFSLRSWKIFRNSKFRYFYYRDYLMNN